MTSNWPHGYARGTHGRPPGRIGMLMVLTSTWSYRYARCSYSPPPGRMGILEVLTDFHLVV